MAIKLEFCNIIIPVNKIREKLGSDIFDKQFSAITDTCWHDGLLWREGCMDDYVLGDILDKWEKEGFQLIEVIDNRKHWKDVCVVNSSYGPSYPCDWIEYDKGKNIVWLKGHNPAESIGPAGRDIHWNTGD
jgi:hypothetical protein